MFVDHSKVMVVGERPVRTFPDGVVNGQLDQKAIHDSKYQADAYSTTSSKDGPNAIFWLADRRAVLARPPATARDERSALQVNGGRRKRTIIAKRFPSALHLAVRTRLVKS